MRQAYWRNYLDRGRLHCRFCRLDPHGELGNPDNGTASSLVLLPTPECNPVRHPREFALKQRAAFMHHVSEWHPDQYNRVRWSRPKR